MHPIPKHPLVNPETGELNLSDQFDHWNSSNNFIFEIIQFARQVFEIDSFEHLKVIVPSIELDGHQPWTKEQIEQFNRTVVKMTHPDKHFIDFNRSENLDDRNLSILKRRLLTTSDKNAENDEMSSGGGHNARLYTASLTNLSWARKILHN